MYWNWTALQKMTSIKTWAWLSENQERIEQQLFKHNSAYAGTELLLYDKL